jgi:hypothetical protein
MSTQNNSGGADNKNPGNKGFLFGGWMTARRNKINTALTERQKHIDLVIGESNDKLIIEDNNKEQKKKFEQEAARLSALVVDDSNSATVTGDCNTLLASGNTLINAASIDRYAVLTTFDKIKQRMIRAYDSRMASLNWFWQITGINLIYMAFFVTVICVFLLIPGQTRLHNTAFVCLACAMWGGVGGVVDAFFALRTHFSQQDFDDEFVPWYFFHPLQGMSMGAVIYLVLTAGLLAINGSPLQESATANMTNPSVVNSFGENVTAMFNQAVEKGSIGATALPIAMAFLAGFRQSTMVNFLTRIVNSILGNSQNDSKTV